MKTDPIILTFDPKFKGEMASPTGQIALGNQENGMKPYHLLYGALGSCFYATFLGVVDKMRLTFDEIKLEITGNKREVVPTMLDHVVMRFTVVNPSHEEKMKKAAHLGAEYCSIHETIKKVAQIDLIVEFDYRT